MSWLVTTADSVILTIKATPRAKRTEVSGVDPDWIRLRIQAPPVDGKANEAIIAFFAEAFKIHRRAVEICTGDTSRLKRIKLHGVSDVAARAWAAGAALGLTEAHKS
jgi:uncharacterized protein (TIGR00251 family)